MGIFRKNHASSTDISNMYVDFYKIFTIKLSELETLAEPVPDTLSVTLGSTFPLRQEDLQWIEERLNGRFGYSIVYDTTFGSLEQKIPIHNMYTITLTINVSMNDRTKKLLQVKSLAHSE